MLSQNVLIPAAKATKLLHQTSSSIHTPIVNYPTTLKMAASKIEKIVESILGDEDVKKFITERGDVPEKEEKDNKDDTELDKALKKASRPARYRPIFAARTDELEKVADHLGGEQIYDDNWYYGFDKVVEEKEFEGFGKLFGKPIKPELVLAQIKTRAVKAATEDHAATANLVVQQLSKQFSGLLRGQNRGNGNRASPQGKNRQNGPQRNGRGGRGGRGGGRAYNARSWRKPE